MADAATSNAASIRRFATDPATFQEELVIPSAQGPARFGDVMADFQRRRFAGLNSALLAVARGEKPRVGRYWWEATKGASKDSDLAVCLLWLLAFTGRPVLCQVGAADQEQAAELRKAANDILRLNGWLARRVRIHNWKIVCDATGAECEIIAADIAGSHGARPDVLILNELSHVTKQEFAENLMDNAAKMPHGLAVIATNAGYTGTWQFCWREIARTSARWCFDKVDRPSPWLDPAEIEEAKLRNSNARYKRLWRGVWASGGGDALDPADIEAAVNPRLLPMAGVRPCDPNDPQTKHLPHLGPVQQITDDDRRVFGFVAGLDIGIKRDHSALVILGANGETQRIRLADCRNWAPPKGGEVDIQAIENAVLEANRRFNLRAVHFDPHRASFLAQRLRKQGVRMEERAFIGKNLDTMATTLMEVFRSRRIDLYDQPRLVSDLMRLMIVEKSFGYKLEAIADADGHADTAIALAIVLPAAVKLTEIDTKPIVIDLEAMRSAPPTNLWAWRSNS